MRRKSPVQQWVDSIPRQEQKPQPIQRVTSHDDISISDESVANIVSPIKSLNLQSTSTPVPVNKNAEYPESLNNDSDVNISCEGDNSVKTADIELNVKLDLYSSSVDSSLVKRTKAPFLRDRSINSEGNSPRHRNALFRDSSQQSDGATSRASSVESLLESRRVDAEAVLRGVGFGPSPARQQLARIPDRFLKPSKVKGVNTEQFIREEQKIMKMHECGVFGYKGLTGHPHAPPSSIVAKIIERISSREDIPDPLLSPPSRQTDIENF